MAKSKGFRVPKRTAKLNFADGDYAGAEVRVVLDVPMGALLEFSQLAKRSSNSDDQADRLDADLEIFRRFGDEMLLEWNLEDDEGQTVSANADGLMALPRAFVEVLMAKWLEAVTSPPAPLGQPSNDGDSSQVA